jgi:hypothetical protein
MDYASYCSHQQAIRFSSIAKSKYQKEMRSEKCRSGGSFCHSVISRFFGSASPFGINPDQKYLRDQIFADTFF